MKAAPFRLLVLIRSAFTAWKQALPEAGAERLKLSWSNWDFGRESLSESAKRLQKAGVRYMELKGNHHGTNFRLYI